MLATFVRGVVGAVRDLAPIILVIAFFQIVVLQQPFPNLGAVVAGLVCVIAGLTLFIQGLESGLFPLGEEIAQEFAHKGSLSALLAFAFCLGFGTTVAEPALIAVAAEAAEVAAEGGAITANEAARAAYAFNLRMVVAVSVGAAIVLGVVRILKGWPIHRLIIGGYVLVTFMTLFAPDEIIGVAYDSGGVTTSTITVPLVTALGCLRIVTGTPLPWYILAAYVVVILQTFRSSHTIVPLAYDSGGVTTSTVTVPVVAALGLGLAASVPGRSPLIDGFGLIAFASVFPIITVLGYAMAASWLSRRRKPEAAASPES